MHLAFSRLGWCPRDFWQATPRELAIALGAMRRDAPLGGNELRHLMNLYPDREG